MATIKILGGVNGSFPTQSAQLLFNQLTIKTSTGGQKIYNTHSSIVSVDIVSEHKGKVIFDIKLYDDAYFRGEAKKSIIHDFVKYAGVKSGTANVAEKSSKQVAKEQKIATVIAVIIMLFFVYKCSGDSALTDDSARAIGATLCEHRVKGMLRSPSTADFPFASGRAIISTDKQSITYTSYVDSQNGFGATIRTNFVCELNLTGSNPGDVSSWDVKDVMFLR